MRERGNNTFTYNGKSSELFGLHIDTPSTASAPKLIYETINIPFRSHAIIDSSCCYENVDVKYKTWMRVPNEYDRGRVTRRLKSWLMADPEKYKILYDSYDGDFCRLATYIDGLNIDVAVNDVLESELSFSADPYLYKLSSLNYRPCSNGEILSNPFSFPARPKIKMLASGNPSFSLGAATWQLWDVANKAEIDCETMVVLQDEKEATIIDRELKDFFLPPGNTKITWDSTISKMWVAPCWRCL